MAPLREKFWNDLNMVIDKGGNGNRLYVLGDLNEWVGDKMRASITGAFIFLGENDNAGG